MKRAFDRKVRPRVYHVGDMVLKRILPPQNDRRGKWTPNYEEIGRKRLVQKAESTESLEDIWGVTELELDEITGSHCH
ncbi:hypothetical protein KIW84_011603 [Lathyrus oleraceus]|uniref:Uncharacterized protein n=1 Tax=Pisum sativum TaxID=3888 RepID=A0A9D5BFF4_PEA|nr:hypothetical protein KIW84_011603 [Pisum sativum]